MQYACFSCRKVFKQPSLKGASGHFVPSTQSKASQAKIKAVDASRFACPQCGNPMEIMGRNFKAPRHANQREWKKIKLLVQNGFRFFSSGYNGRNTYPEKFGELGAFLKKGKAKNIKD
jgi:predicted RNA-binding Zn-ribbon protein involved in translation (DUF1610 family)